ncbi:MAG: type II secretion system protein GspM [Myxococcota bacterium]|nr:type II secretion system protein GspM [Myxococcota bacterium]
MNALMQRLIDAWSGISAREQMLVGVAVGLTILSILFVGIVQPIIGLSTTVASRVDAAEQELLAMNRLRRQYDIVNTSLSKVEERILSNHEKRNLLTLLESLAAASSVQVNSMEERKAQDDEKYKETRVEVRLKSVSLKDTVSYLTAIESSDQLLTVKSLRIKKRSDRSNLLDVTFNVSTFDIL